MTNGIDFIRDELDQLGCSLQERIFTTEDGSRLWFVFCRQEKQQSCLDDGSQREAWILAWDIKKQIQNINTAERSMILSFPRSSKKIKNL
jgi:hypothetical protein